MIVNIRRDLAAYIDATNGEGQFVAEVLAEASESKTAGYLGMQVVRIIEEYQDALLDEISGSEACPACGGSGGNPPDLPCLTCGGSGRKHE